MINRFRVGLRTHQYNITWPFVICLIESDKIILKSAFGLNKIILFKTILKAGLYKGVLFSGVKLIVISEQVENEIIIWIKSGQIEMYNAIKNGMNSSHQNSYMVEESDCDNENIDLRGFALKNWFVGSLILLWNIPILLLYFSKYGESLSFDVKASYKLIHGGLILIILFLLLSSKLFQKLTLKKGRSILEIRGILVLAILILCVLILNTYTLHFINK
jgi:hypothetical protein